MKTKYLVRIPEDQLKEFVGEPYDKIDQIAVSPTNVRVNVWVRDTTESEIISPFRLDRSYFLYYNGSEIADITIRKDQV